MRSPLLLTTTLGALLLLPASAPAATQTFGSDLSQPATLVQEHQADTAFWSTSLHGGQAPLVPAAGQIKEVRVKGLALRRPDSRPAGSPGGETMFHVQAIAGNRFRITSQAFYMPTSGDPQQVTTFRPENFCVQPGEKIAFNTVGGYDAVGGQPKPGEAHHLWSPYPNGTPLRIFASVPGARTEWYEQANGTDNGEALAAHGSGPREADQGPASSGRLDGQELLMQMTLATGDDRSYECGGPNTYRPTHTDPTGPPRVEIQKATLPVKQTVRVSKKGDAGMAIFCFAGTGPCRGTVTVLAGRAKIASKPFSVAQKSTGKLKLRLSKVGRKAFTKRRGKLPVTIVAVTAPGGAERTTVLKTVLRKHRPK